MEEKNPEAFNFQLRRDAVTGDWVAYSTKNRKKIVFERHSPKVSEVCKKLSPRSKTKDLRGKTDKKCVFCQDKTWNQPEDTLIYVSKKRGEWTLRVFAHPTPIFSPVLLNLNQRDEGPYEMMDGAGFHEIMVTKEHCVSFADMDVVQIAEVLDAYQERYLNLMSKKNVKFISLFSDYGESAGANWVHPHSQIVAMPVVDPDVRQILEGSRKYFERHNKCVHCLIVGWELEKKTRVLFENEEFVAFCPFVSRSSFEIQIFPKRHLSYFERILDEQKMALAEAIKRCLSMVKTNLEDSDYNMFINTAPCDGEPYDYYHWHISIVPKVNLESGIELSAGVEVCSILPEEAAKVLKKQ